MWRGGSGSRRDSVVGAGVILEFIEAYGTAGVHVLDALANAFEYPGLLGHLVKI